MTHRRLLSETAQVAREVLSIVGTSLGALAAGSPDVRGQSGYVYRLREGCFEEVCDVGPGWTIECDVTSSVDLRVILLLHVWVQTKVWITGVAGCGAVGLFT